MNASAGEEEGRARRNKRRSARARAAAEFSVGVSATYHEAVNSAPTFPREIIIFPLVKSESVTLMRAYIRREK